MPKLMGSSLVLILPLELQVSSFISRIRSKNQKQILLNAGLLLQEITRPGKNDPAWAIIAE